MNMQPLQPLTGRWPNDTSNPDFAANLGIAEAMRSITEPAAFFKDMLRVDPADSQAVAAFAAANGMQYQTYGMTSSNYTRQHPPAWVGFLAAVTTPNLLHEVKGTVFGYAATFCLEYTPQQTQTDSRLTQRNNPLQFTTASNPSSRELELDKRSIIRVSLPKVFPQIVLDSNKNDQGHTSTIPTTIEPDQLIALEGDFQNYFDFYAPLGLQVNTLTILAPNFMQILMDSAATFDVEIYGNELILVTRECIYDPAVMAQALQALQAQLAYFDRLLTSWNYEPVAPPFDVLRYPFVNGSVVKVGKLRIRPLTMVALVLAGFVLYGILILIL